MSILKVTKENFEQEVLHSAKPVLLDFWASWCGPCRMAAPILEQMTADVKNNALIGKINIEEEPELTEQFGVTSIPTFLVIRNGRVTQKAVGLQDRTVLLKMLEQ